MGHGVTEPVALRDLTLDDVTERYVAWLNDPEVNAALESRFTAQTLETVREFVSAHAGREDVLMLAVIEPGGRHVGNVKVGPLSSHHGTADLGLFIGEREVWGRGYATSAIRQATALAFERLGARKLTASCYTGNVGSAAAFRRAGWTEEGVRPGQFVAADGSVQGQLMFGTFST